LNVAIENYRRAGLKHVLCTDVARDGALSGPNVELYAAAQATHSDIAFQASGGIRDAADLFRLADSGVAAAISGKALLEHRIRFEEIQPFLPNA
jgi:phosphoribosylformimino-5-aminoimidazole carboxamide ribotide isomerase